jgi:transposase
MPRSRPPYPAEFRQQIIELAHAGRSPAELSREFGCTAQTIANWLGAAGGAPHTTSKSSAEALSAAEREELIRLRRQVRQIQMERDILAKATAWFAAKSDKTFTPSSNL